MFRQPWIWVAALLAAWAGPAFPQNFGQFTSAKPIEPGTHLFGGYITAADEALGMLAQLRLSFMPKVDFGFQGGMSRLDIEGDDRTTVRLGTDLKVGLLDVSSGSPVDFSLGGALGVLTGDDITVLSLGPSLAASRSFPAGNANLIPYAGLYLRFSSVDVGAQSDSDFDLAFRLGADLRISPDFGFIAEFQANEDSGGDFGFATGLNVAF
jgi:hypothetical protein